MTTILSKLNRQLKRNDRHILLFMDNAPCHPQTLSGQFSNITVQFLPKNTTSKSEPLDAGITNLWITSLLFDLNYEIINRSFGFSPG